MKIPFWGKAFQYFRALSKYMAGPPLEWTALPESRDAIVKELIKTFQYATQQTEDGPVLENYTAFSSLPFFPPSSNINAVLMYKTFNTHFESQVPYQFLPGIILRFIGCKGCCYKSMNAATGFSLLFFHLTVFLFRDDFSVRHHTLLSNCKMIEDIVD